MCPKGGPLLQTFALHVVALVLWLVMMSVATVDASADRCTRDVPLYELIRTSYSGAAAASDLGSCPCTTESGNATTWSGNNNTTSLMSNSSGNVTDAATNTSTDPSLLPPCVRCSPCAQSIEVPTVTAGDVFLPSLFISGRLSQVLDTPNESSLIALVSVFSSLWTVTSGACTLDVLWETQTDAPQSANDTAVFVGHQFALVLNAPQWSAQASLLTRRSVVQMSQGFTADRPEEVQRGGATMFEPQDCIMEFASGEEAGATSVLFHKLFGPPNASRIESSGANASSWESAEVAWSLGAASLRVSFSPSIDRFAPPALETAMVMALLFTQSALVPVVPVASGLSVSAALLFVSPFCSAEAAYEADRFHPLTSALPSIMEAGDSTPAPQQVQALEGAVAYFCLLSCLVLVRGIASLLIQKGPPWRVFDGQSRLLLSVAAVGPVVCCLSLAALLGPISLPQTPSTNTSYAPLTPPTWGESDGSVWAYGLAVLACLLGVLLVSALGIWLPFRLRAAYGAVDEELRSTVSRPPFARADVPCGMVALVAAVVQSEGLAQPSMPLLAPFASVLSSFRAPWEWWGLLSGMLPWLHAVLFAVPGSILPCGVSQAVLAGCWAGALILLVAQRPMWHSPELIACAIGATLMVTSLSTSSAFYLLDDPPYNQTCLALSQTVAVVLSILLVGWTLIVGFHDVRCIFNRTMATRTLWDGDEMLWWQRSVRSTVSSILQQSAEEEEEEEEEEDMMVEDRTCKEAPELVAPPAVPINVLEDDMDALAHPEPYGDDFELLDWQQHSSDEADTTVTPPLLPFAHQWASLRRVREDTVDLLLVDHDGSDTPTEVDVVVDYSDVELLGGTLHSPNIDDDDDLL